MGNGEQDQLKFIWSILVFFDFHLFNPYCNSCKPKPIAMERANMNCLPRLRQYDWQTIKYVVRNVGAVMQKAGHNHDQLWDLQALVQLNRFFHYAGWK